MNLSSWKIAYIKEGDGVSILRAESCDRIAVLPESIDGLPVVSLGSRALSPFKPDLPADAERLCIGPGSSSDDEWDNRDIEELILPSSLLRVGNAAFIYMSSLKTISFDERLEIWNGNALSSCRALERVVIRKSGSGGTALAHIVEDMERMLDVSIEDRDGVFCRLIFPSYEEMIMEDGCVAQGSMFSYHINGAGYPHHHCFIRKQLSLKDYDNLWAEYTGMGFIPEEAIKLAWYRLRYPFELAEKAKEAYTRFIVDRADELLDLLVAERDREGLSFLLSLSRPSEEAIKKATAYSRENNIAELIPLLLEASRSFKRVADDYEL